jgi:hypothetical protein
MDSSSTGRQVLVWQEVEQGAETVNAMTKPPADGFS